MNEKLGGNSVEGRMDIGNDEVREQLRKLSGHLAHDFNNLLTPLLAYPQLIRQDLPSEGASRELLDVMEETAETLANISRRLGDFALPCRPAKHPVTIDTVVREVIAAIENENLALGISVKPVHDAGINVMVPHDALYGPLKAICENALEAMGGMGTLSVTANAVSIDDTFPPVHGVRVPPGQYARIQVHDTGPSMTEQVREKAFEPFFTTHKHTKARGSGLGLSIALATVRDCEGFIVLGDQEDEGFSVSLLFPAVSDLVASDMTAGGTGEDTEDTEKERVLVVDDEEPIVELFKLMLESVIPGIEVDVARNGREAITAFESGHHSVIVMDLHMPVMDGQSAFTALSELCQANGWDMPGVIFCTGYAPPAGVKQVISGNAQHDLLHKPVTTEHLVRAVKERLRFKT